ncbi:MAG: hypothetical protein J6U01_09925 [Clostridia bacterium]|nr:hypothetical protein [Clostridia bacterium]
MRKTRSIRLLTALLGLVMMLTAFGSATAEAETWQEMIARKDYSGALPLVQQERDRAQDSEPRVPRL